MRSAGDIHKLTRLTLAYTCDKVAHLRCGIDVEGSGNLSVNIVEYININYGRTAVNDERKLLFGVLGGVVYLKRALNKGRAVNYIAVVGGYDIISNALESRDVLNNDLS